MFIIIELTIMFVWLMAKLSFFLFRLLLWMIIVVGVGLINLCSGGRANVRYPRLWWVF